MSYAGLGVAIPMTRGARGVRAMRGVKWRRGLYGLGAGAPAPTDSSAPDMTFSLADPDVAASAAVSAIMAASATARRSPIAQVRDFQSAYGHGLTVDGIYGPATRAALVSVTGRTDLPAVGSSGTTTSRSSSTSTSIPDTSVVVPGTSPRPAWLVPVAVVSTLVLIAGGAMYLMTSPKKAVAANRRTRRNGRRRRR